MVIKKYKVKVFAYGLILLILSIGISLNNKSVEIIIHDYYEVFMSNSPGFSSLSNLTNNGTNHSQTYTDKISNLFKKVDNFVAYKLLDGHENTIPKISILIDFSSYSSILNDRKKAIIKGYLDGSKEVKAVVKFSGKEYKAKVRLKGDLNDHWLSGNRMSLRIELEEGKSILGFNSFSIHKPRARQYPSNQLFQRIINRSGNMSATHINSFIEVNGKSWGIMDLEERISKEFIEKQKRKDSLIFRFSNDKKWTINMLLSDKEKEIFKKYRVSDPRLHSTLYKKKKYLKNKTNRDIYTYVLKNRLDSNLDILYDRDTHIVNFFISLIWNSMHALYDTNSRYYFNPYTLMLEPITSDQGYFKPHTKSLTQVLSSYSIPDNYINSISSISSLNELSDFIDLAIDAFKNMHNELNNIQATFPLDEKKDLNVLLDNMNFVLYGKEEIFQWINKIKEVKSINEPNADSSLTEFTTNEIFTNELIKTWHHENGDFSFFNLTPYPVLIESILVNGLETEYKDIQIPGYGNYSPKIIKTDIKGIYDGAINIKSKYKQHKQSVVNTVGPTLTNVQINPLKTNIHHDNNIPFIKTENKVFEVQPGDWKIDATMVIEGRLIIRNGTNLTFSDNSYLVVKGGVDFIGTDESPIVLRGSGLSWGGVFVLSRNDKSRIENVFIKDASGVQDGILNLSGGINIYKGLVNIKNLIINNSKSEDALNIVDSKVNIEGLHINSAISDGFDCDYCSGKIINSSVLNVGGDALDFSGSNVVLTGITIDNVRDKGISAGEDSDIIIRDSFINNIGVGIASKDGSEVNADNVSINNFKMHAAMTYIKKGIYNSITSLNIRNCSVIGNHPYKSQKTTNLMVDGVLFKQSILNVEKMYELGVMKK